MLFYAILYNSNELCFLECVLLNFKAFVNNHVDKKDYRGSGGIITLTKKVLRTWKKENQQRSLSDIAISGINFEMRSVRSKM